MAARVCIGAGCYLGPMPSRHELGQWFTPPEVADLALALAFPEGAPARSLRVLDPACGDGAFLSRARAAGVAGENLAGVEVDSAAAEQCSARVPGAVVQCRDLFELEPEALGEGFDAVAGNPPYVRQERLSAGTKRAIRRRLAADWPEMSEAELDQLLGRGDLASACILRALRFARPGARVALVVSSALLDAGYAATLWRLVARVGKVLALIDAPQERWFADAAVNAVILLVERTPSDADSEVTLARLSTSTRAAARRVSCLGDLPAAAEVRVVPGDRPASWAAGLRASRSWFDLEELSRGAMVPLGELAEVRRGVTSGANEVFYLTRERASELGLEKELLAPLVRSPRERGAETILVDPARTEHVALVCPVAAEALARYPVVSGYLRQHEACATRPTLRARSPWWALPVNPARLFLTKAYAARFVQRLAPVPVVADQRVYSVHPRASLHVDLLAAVLNSTFTAFALESLGRASLGEGALEWTVADAATLPVLDPRRLGAEARKRALAALAECAKRPVGDVENERDRADRRALDQAIASVAEGVGGVLPEVHEALVASVRNRAARARSAQPRKG